MTSRPVGQEGRCSLVVYLTEAKWKLVSCNQHTFKAHSLPADCMLQVDDVHSSWINRIIW